MNRRDLICGSAFSLAAANASAQPATPGAGAAIDARGASPMAKPVSGAAASRFYGQSMEIMFTTSTDLTAFMPAGLTPVDPHRAFIKAERMKIRTPEADRRPAAFSQYQQVCITTMALAPSFGARHRNILMWEDRPWAIGSSMVAVKRYGAVEMTEIFEHDRELLQKSESVPFYLDVQNNGFSLLRFAGVLDGKLRAEGPPYSGFYVGGEPGSDLRALTLDSSRLSRPVYGTGELYFGQAPNEQEVGSLLGATWPASLLKDIRVDGCVFQDIAFTRTYGQEFKIVRPRA